MAWLVSCRVVRVVHHTHHVPVAVAWLVAWRVARAVQHVPLQLGTPTFGPARPTPAALGRARRIALGQAGQQARPARIATRPLFGLALYLLPRGTRVPRGRGGLALYLLLAARIASCSCWQAVAHEAAT